MISFLAFSGSGVINPVTLTDFEELDVLGWNLVETAPTVTPLTASVGEDDPSPSKDLLTGTADAESDFLSVQNLDSTVTTSGGRSSHARNGLHTVRLDVFVHPCWLR